MSRKAFVLWGLGLFHAYLLIIAIVAYMVISKIIPRDILRSALNPGPLLSIALMASYGVILWKRFNVVGRRKRTLIWCFIFYLVATALGSFMVMFYLDAADFASNAMMPFVHASLEGGVPTVWIKMRFTLYLIPGFYLGNWGLFALLWFGSRDPKAPISIWQKAKRLIIRTPKQTPLQADPILMNGAW